MIAIVDGGSTKCDSVILENSGEPNLKTTTLGFNPNIINPEFILQEIDKNQELFFLKNHIEKVFFYGSGCGTPDNRKKVADEFTKAFPNADFGAAFKFFAHANNSSRRGFSCSRRLV